jgi:outer membrane autotransporter protein
MTTIRSRCKASASLVRTTLLAVAVLCWAAPVHADQSTSFVWVADTRGNNENDLINTNVLTPIVDRILAMSTRPNFVVFGGDAGFTGGTDNLNAFNGIFTNRLTGVGIPVAFAIGNHELMTADPANPDVLVPTHAKSRQEEFQALFNGGWTQNGPSGYSNLAFSFHMGNSLFIIADSFYATTNGVTPSYGISAAQQDWMRGLLANNTAAHTFVLTHIPAYGPWTPSLMPNMIDTWQTITTAGAANNTNASILFTGHEHLYYRTTHDGVYEVLAGTGGAPYACEAPAGATCGPVQPGDVYSRAFNYATVSVDGRYITVNVAAYDPGSGFSSLDIFTFFDNSGVNNSTINNITAINASRSSGILAGSHNIITNSADISGVDTGIDAVSNNIITNSAAITPSDGGNGIHVYDNNRITNTMTGSITGDSAGSTGFWGIRVGSGNTVVNEGTIGVSGTNSIGFLVRGDNNNLMNNDAGTITASGTNAYAAKFFGTGNLLVNAGTISGNLWFDGGVNTFDNNGTYSGQITVNSGTLVIGSDTVEAMGGIHAPVTVNAGGALAGATFVGDVTVKAGGTLAPGHLAAIGTMFVDGGLTLMPGSLFAIRILPTASDRADVTGAAALNGAVSVFAGAGMYVPDTAYTIIRSLGGVTGSFSGVTSNFTSAFLTPTLSYSPTTVFLTLTRGPAAFASAAQTPNQFGVAHALDQFPSANPLLVAAANQTLAGGRQAFDALSGEVHGSAQTAIVNDSIYMRQAVLGRLRQAPFSSAAGPMAALGSGGPTIAFAESAGGYDGVPLAYADKGAPGAREFPVEAPGVMLAATNQKYALWGQAIGAWGQMDGDGNAAAARRNLAGFISGIDRRAGDNWHTGIAAGYSTSSVSVSERASSATIGTAHLAPYVGANYGAWNFRSGVDFSWNAVATTRSVLFPGFAENATANYGAGGGQAFGEIGYGVAIGKLAAEPFAGLAYVHLSTTRFTEAGGVSALTGASDGDDAGYSTLGARVAANYFLPKGMALTPRASLAWQHAFGDVTPAASLAFASTGIAFGTAGLPLARDAAHAEAGLDLHIHPQAAVGISYFGELATGAQDHSVKGNFIWRF